MKKNLKENWKFLLFVLIGGYFTGLYMYDSLSGELLKQIQEQNITKEMLGLMSIYQYGILYGVLLAIIGVILSKKVNLWKKFEYNKKAIIVTSLITIIGALILFPGDKLIFGSLSSFVYDSYAVKPTISKVISGLLVGGIIEEVIMRLFLMSLLVWITSIIFYKNKDIPVKVYIIANVISVLLFAAGHLPSTSAMTTLTPLLIFRCFLFNGGIGLTFGYLYRKYGIGYSMLAHGLSHLIADALMIIFI